MISCTSYTAWRGETNSLAREAKAWEFVKRWIPDDPGPCPNKYWRDPSPAQRIVKTLELYYSYWVQHDSDVKPQHYRAPQHLAFYSLASLPPAEAAAASVCMLITLVPALLPSSTAKIHLIREPLMLRWATILNSPPSIWECSGLTLSAVS